MDRKLKFFVFLWIVALLSLPFRAVLYPQGMIIANGVSAPIALIGSGVSAVSTTTNNVTTGSYNTTGATFLVLAQSGVNNTTATISDSKTACATWTGLTARNTSARQLKMWYCANPASVGSGHTFTASTSGQAPGICVAAFSGVATTTPFDVQNGATTESAATLATGSITPTTDNQVVVTGVEIDQSSVAFTINLSFSIVTQINNGGNGIGCGIAYKVQTTAAAVNPTWTTNNGAQNIAAAIASFKHS